MSKINYKIFLASLLSFILFFSFFQISQAGFFDWFRKNDSQSAATVVSKTKNTKQYTLSVSKSGLGVVTSDDGKINCGKQCKASYPANSKIVLKAEAGSGYKFERWNGCDTVSDGKCQTILNKSKMVVAKFVKKGLSSSQKNSKTSKSSSSSSKASSSKSSGVSSKSSSSSYSSRASSSKAFSSSSSSANKSSSSVSKSSLSSFGFSSSSSNIINSNELDKNVFIVKDDGTLIRTGCVQSESGCQDQNDTVDKQKTLKKFFQEHFGSENVYDFVMIATTFKPNSNIGEFASTKNVISGTGDSHGDINLTGLRQQLGLTGNEKIQGYAFVMSLDDAVAADLRIPLHEISHRWLFRIGDYDTCGKGFGCTKETGLKINTDGGHYNSKINTTTKDGGNVYFSPNGGGSLQLGSVPGYCLDHGGNSGYRFNTIDLYLMGLIPAEEAGSLKWYQTSGSWSEKGVLCTEKTLTTQDIINLYGKRDTSYPNTQKDFSVAYLLLTRKDEKLSSSQIGKVNFLANQFPKEWYKATNYKSTINGIK